MQGYLTNLELQKKIWDHIFSNELKIDFKETPIIFTEPYFNFLSIQKAVTELFFEEYKCQALLRINGMYVCKLCNYIIADIFSKIKKQIIS